MQFTSCLPDTMVTAWIIWGRLPIKLSTKVQVVSALFTLSGTVDSLIFKKVVPIGKCSFWVCVYQLKCSCTFDMLLLNRFTLEFFFCMLNLFKMLYFSGVLDFN